MTAQPENGRLVWRKLSELAPHPQVGELPALGEADYLALKADIAGRGLQTPLDVTEEGIVLDGHARLRAAAELGIEQVELLIVDPADDLEHMLRAALHRLHLDASQKAALALKLAPYEQLKEQAHARQQANLRHGDAAPEVATLPTPDKGEESHGSEVATLPGRDRGLDGRTRDRVAELAGVCPRTMQDVITVREHDPELFEQILRGERKAASAASQIRRALRDANIAPAPPLPEGPFELIYADPPWQFGSPDSEYAPEQHYPCMALSEIKALKAPAADDCVLFCWACNSLLLEALEVITAWGFSYRNNLVWVKNGIGPGVWLRQRHELLLVATRGNVPVPEPPDRVDSVIEAARNGHSRKPVQAYERIERMYPQRSKLELFARDSRPGWTSWGNQAPNDEHST